MLSRNRRILTAVLLASALPLSLTACEGKESDKASESSTAGAGKDEPADSEDAGKGDAGGDGEAADPEGGGQEGDEEGTDVGPCDDKTKLQATIGSGKQSGDTGSAVITVKNTGSGPCVLTRVLSFTLSDEDGGRVGDVQVFNSDGEVGIASQGTASAKLNYTVDKAASPVSGGQFDLDQIGRLAVDKTGGPVDMADGTVQLTAFSTD